LAFWITFGKVNQHADAPHPLALLRAYRHRPRGCRAAEKANELTSLHIRPSSGASIVSA
jgi:hypothetical protein